MDVNEFPEQEHIPASPEPEGISGDVPMIARNPDSDMEPAVQEPVEQASSEDLEQAPDAEEIRDETLAEDPQSSEPALQEPELGAEITPDEDSMLAHGMLEHGEEEPDFDMSILDSPDFPPQETVTEQEDDSVDQEYRDNGQDFDALMNTPPTQEDPPAQPHPVKKGRPKRRRTEWLLGIPQIASTLVWLALILAIGVTAGRMLWICAADVLAFGRDSKTVTVTIYESDSMDQIAEKLHTNGLIRYKGLFKLYADISDADKKIKPGIYDLNTLYDYHALVNFMTPRSSREVIDVTIPEGYSCRQIFALLEEKRICTARDIGAYAASGELDDYWFLENVARGDKYCLEGFLFPDTYQFYKNSSPREALERMLDNFDVRFDEEMRARIETLNAELTGNYTVREIAIVASLIEKESAAPAESPAIAGVIYNRLFQWNGTPAYLNIDASVIYALDGKTDLTREDLQTDSLFNTYTHTGLTPTPIANPGLSSLRAALNPENHGYYYYVLNPATGMHQFSTTYEEHTGYVNQFAQQRAQQ